MKLEFFELRPASERAQPEGRCAEGAWGTDGLQPHHPHSWRVAPGQDKEGAQVRLGVRDCDSQEGNKFKF